MAKQTGIQKKISVKTVFGQKMSGSDRETCRDQRRPVARNGGHGHCERR
jgi:ribosomal protein L4